MQTKRQPQEAQNWKLLKSARASSQPHMIMHIDFVNNNPV